MQSRFALMLVVLALSPTACIHNKPSASPDQPAAQASCQAAVNGRLYRCMEYRGYDGDLLKEAESLCGEGELAGFTWSEAGCPESDTLYGTCSETSDGSTLTHYFYDNAESAYDALCADASSKSRA